MARVSLVSDRSATPAQFDSTGATNGQGLIYNAATGLWVPGSVGGTGAISSVFGRTGAITAQLGDYTAAQVTNAADKSSTSKQAFAGEVAPPDLAPAGLPGATAASRYVGATTFGAPSTGTFLKGDWIVDQSGNRWTCTTGGSPGTWTQEQGAGGGSVTSVFGRTGAVVSATGDYTAAQVTNAADKSSSSQQAFSGELRSPDLSLSGLTGATAAGRYVGSTVSGAPISGSFLQGDWVSDEAGIRWTCTAAGSPGTWTQEPGVTLASVVQVDSGTAPRFDHVTTETDGYGIYYNAASGKYKGRPEPINVMTYGAVGDGVTDDTTAIQNAVNAASALGTSLGVPVTVVFPSGFKFLMGSINILSYVRLWCFGAVILPNANNWNNTHGLLDFRGAVNGTLLTRFSIFGGVWVGSNAAGITGQNQNLLFLANNFGLSNFLAYRMEIQNWPVSGILRIRNPTDCDVVGCTISNALTVGDTGGQNILNFSPDGTASTGGRIRALHNTITQSQAAAIAVVNTGTTGFSGTMAAIFAHNFVQGISGSSISSGNSGAVSVENDLTLAWDTFTVVNNIIVAYPTLNHGALNIGSGGSTGSTTKFTVAHNIVSTPGAAGSGIQLGSSGTTLTGSLKDNDLSGCPIPIHTPGLTAGSAVTQVGNRFSTGLSQGRAVLVAGTVTVSTAEVVAGDNIILTRVVAGGTLGQLSVGTITAGVSFVINSSSNTDTSTVYWKIDH